MSASTALRRLPVPDVLPPVEALAARPLVVRQAAGEGAAQAQQGVLSLVLGDGGGDEDGDDFGPVPTSSSDLPEPRAWSRSLVQVLVEVMAGLRGPSQLLRWTTSDVHEAILAQRRRAASEPSPRRPGRRPLVRRVRVCEPADGVAEVCAVVAGGRRTRALALRLEGHDGRWRVTALEVG